MLSLKLTPHGFAPASVTAPKGDYFITVHNATELDGLELRLDREPSERKAAGRVSREVLRWNEYVKLHPGEYVVTEAGHPEWTCRITVTPHDE